MKSNDMLKRQVIMILTKWNPLEVPELVAEDEYQTFVKPIIAIGKNPTRLKSFLTNLLCETFGLQYQEENKEQKTDVENVVNKLIQIFSDRPGE